ncbi:MAG: hypothetical protein HY747_05735 [Elusimicrobia bacterium]|nr:hypothetical protein [Elusimicrobiota bacterium]
MQFDYAESFHKTADSLDRHQARRLLKGIGKFEVAWEMRRFPKGLGLTRLREDFYEFRVDIHNRVLFERSGDCILYLLCGSHDDIRRFLKNF